MSKKWRKAPRKNPPPPPEKNLVLQAQAVIGIEAQSADGQEKRRTFRMVAATGEPLTSQYQWDAPLVIDLAGLEWSDPLPILDHHGSSYGPPGEMRASVVGQSTQSKVTKDGFEVAGLLLTKSSPAAADIAAKADEGYEWQASIGAKCKSQDFIAEGSSGQANGRTYEGPCYISRRTLVREVSFVVIGDDPGTSVIVASGGAEMAKQTFAEWAKANGFPDTEKLTGEQMKCLKAAYEAAMKAQGDDEEENTESEEDEEDVDAQGDEEEEEEGGDEEEEDAEACNTRSTGRVNIRARGSDGGRLSTPKWLRNRRLAEAREEDRIDAIRAICKDNPGLKIKVKGKEVNLQTHAIRAGWSKEKVELMFLRQARSAVEADGSNPGNPITWYSPGRPLLNEAVIEAAVLEAGNCQLYDPAFLNKPDRQPVPFRLQREIKAEMSRYTDQVQQSAHDLWKGRIGFQQVLTAGARMNGWNGPDHLGSDDGLIESCLRGANWRRSPMTIQAADGASYNSLANVLANVLNKFLLEGYLFAETAWMDVAATRPVKDFKPTKTIALWGDFEFKEVGPDGELKHAQINDQAFANQVDTYGRLILYPRKTIINDDLSALTTTPKLMGRGSGLAINKLFWTNFMDTTGLADDGVAFWSASHTNKNYIDGATTTLTSEGLRQGKLAFDQQVDPNGDPLGIDAAILLVPPDLWITGRELVDPAALGLVYGGATASKQPNVNIWKGIYRLVMSRYLSNTAYSGYSAVAWYLLAAPGECPVIEAAFLNGQQTPTVQTAQADFNQLGIQIRGFHDFGVTRQNFRGGLKSKGAA